MKEILFRSHNWKKSELSLSQVPLVKNKYDSKTILL